MEVSIRLKLRKVSEPQGAIFNKYEGHGPNTTDLGPSYSTSLPTSPTRGSKQDYGDNLDAWLDGPLANQQNQQEYPPEEYPPEEGYDENYPYDYDENYVYEGGDNEGGWTNQEGYEGDGYDNYEGYAQGNEGEEYPEGYSDQNYYAYDNAYYDTQETQEVVNNTNQNV